MFDPADQLGRMDTRIGLVERIALRDESAVGGNLDDAMHEQPAPTREHDNLSLAHVMVRTAANVDGVVGPNGREHARAEHVHADPAEATEHFRSQFAGDGAGMMKVRGVHEFRRLARQENCVVLTLPQASAIVSKTCSWRKDGRTYGFFLGPSVPGSLRGVSDFMDVFFFQFNF